MTAELFDESPIAFSQLGGLFPNNTSLCSLYRYALKGKRGADGEMHLLDSFISGNKRFSSAESVRRFLIATNSPKSDPVETSPATRSRQKSAAADELSAMGIRSASPTPTASDDQKGKLA